MQDVNSTALKESEEEDEAREIFTIPPVPEALLIVSNCVPSAMLMSVISDASSSATESVESDLNWTSERVSFPLDVMMREVERAVMPETPVKRRVVRESSAEEETKVPESTVTVSVVI